MKIRENVKTLTFKLWMSYVGFAISLFVILWLMQVIFVQSYYSLMKQAEIRKVADLIEEQYISGEYIDVTDKLAYKNYLTAYVADKYGEVKYTTMYTNRIQPPNNKGTLILDISKIVKIVKNTPGKEIGYTIDLERFKTKEYIFAKKMQGTDNYLIISTSIEPLDITIKILKSQLMYITIIALTIASIISIFISQKLSMPLKKITESANKLARGRFDVKFEKAGYKEIDELADTLNYATKQLEETDNVRKELIANVSHDLKTPLTMIKAYAEMIRDLSGDNKEKREKHLEVIINETDRLTRLVNDMMDLSAAEVGLAKITPESFNITEATRGIIQSFETLEDKKYNVRLIAKEEIYVYADKIKIEQVIYNLISNAINHTKAGTKIAVKIILDGKHVMIRVMDNGQGISEENLKNIWSRYYKVSDNFRREAKGSGLGLSIVKNILENHDAKYGVDSQVDKGTTFWFELKASKKKITKEEKAKVKKENKELKNENKEIKKENKKFNTLKNNKEKNQGKMDK